jgi:hypothetical protein
MASSPSELIEID